MKYVLSALILGFAFISPAIAKEVVSRLEAMPEKECPFNETSSINVSFNSTETELSQLKTIMATKISQIEAYAKDKGITKIELQNSSYSISTNSSGNCDDAAANFQFYGNASFNVEPADKGAEFMSYLVEKGITANLSMNSYRQCQ